MYGSDLLDLASLLAHCLRGVLDLTEDQRLVHLIVEIRFF